MSVLASMQIKFFDRDVVGDLPEEKGDTFQAEFFGGLNTFKVENHCGNFYMAVMV